MPTEEIKIKITSDKTAVDKDFKDIKGTANKVQAGSSKAASSIASVINAVVGSAAVGKITRFFSAAISSYNRLESAMLRVDSIAKAFGVSTQKARKEVQDLADKGFLNLNQAADSYANAIALGFDDKKARKFVDALSDIAAYQNTIGNGAEAVSSGLAGLLSNSAEKVENIGVPVKVLNQQYQQNITTMGKAAAIEKFYQGILKESTKFQGDAARSVDTLAGAQNKYAAAVEKVEVAVGKGLEPIMKGLYSIGQKLAEAFAGWFSGLNSNTKSILVVSVGVSALAIAFAALGPIFETVGLSAAKMWKGITGPIGLVIAAVTTVALIASSLYDKYANTKGQDHLEERKALQEIAKQQELSISQRERLKQLNKEIGESYDPIIKKLGLENVGFEDQLRILRAIDKEREKAKSGGAAAGAISRAKLEETVASQKKLLEQAGSRDISGLTESQKLEHTAKIEALSKDYHENQARLATYEETAGKKPVESMAAQGSEVRFIETRKKLEEIAQKERFTIVAAMNAKIDNLERERRVNNAKRDAQYQREEAINGLRQAYAEYIEDKYMADQAALEKSTNDAKRASREQLEAQIRLNEEQRSRDLEQYRGNKEAEEAINELYEEKNYKLRKVNLDRLQKISEANTRKQAQLAAESFAATANAAAGIAKGIGQFKSGDYAAGTVSALSGAAGFGKGLEGLGLIKAGGGASSFLGALGIGSTVVSAVSGLGSAIGDLFSKSDAERAKEAAEMQRRQEEQQKILELQASYQKSMLTLQEAQAKLPFENLTRNLRLIDINAQKQILSGGDANAIESDRQDARLAAIKSVLAEQSGTISQNQLFNNIGSSPDELIGFLNRSAALRNQLGPLIALAQSGQEYKRTDYYSNGTQQDYGIFAQFESELARLGYSVGDYRLGAVRYSQLGNDSKARVQDLINQGYTPAGISQASVNYSTKITDMDKLVYAADQQARLSSIGNDSLNQLLSEFNSDVGIAENLLSVIEQSNQIQLDIQSNTKKTADNTTKLAESKGDAIVDVAAGGVTQNGAFVKGGLLGLLTGRIQYDPAASLLNSPQMQNVALATTMIDNMQERMAKGLDKLISLTEEEVAILTVIAENLTKNTLPESQTLRQQVLDIIEEFRSRT